MAFLGIEQGMRAAGYLAKFIEAKPEDLACAGVSDIYSVSNCVSGDFCDYVGFWKHNGFWFFDTPATIQDVATLAGVSLAGTTLFYYEVHDLEYDQEREDWVPFEPEHDAPLAVLPPIDATLHGFDVVSFCMRSHPECSPLSCNGLASVIAVNSHCLLPSLPAAIESIGLGDFATAESGTLRVFSVSSVPWRVA